MNALNKHVILSIALIPLFGGCTTLDAVYIKQGTEFGSTGHPLGNQACATLMTSTHQSYLKMQRYCANMGKKVKVTSKHYLTDCSLTYPVVYNFDCE